MGLHSGRWTFLGQGLASTGLFWGLTISPHSHIPVTNIPEYPPPPRDNNAPYMPKVDNTEKSSAVNMCLPLVWPYFTTSNFIVFGK